MKKFNKEIPVIFSADDNYIPYLNVAIYSLVKNVNKNNLYSIYILNTGISTSNQRIIRMNQTENVKIHFMNVKRKIAKLTSSLNLRDYYSESIYYRLFIPSLFNKYTKVIYLDSDIVIDDDISLLYDIDIGNNLLGVVKDAVVAQDTGVLKSYVEDYVGVENNKYFNSGMLLMNVDEFKIQHIEERFIDMMNKYELDTIAPDQDYLNVLAKGKTVMLDESWNLMIMNPSMVDKIHIVHYNMFLKPWKYKDVPYASLFWKYAQETIFYDKLIKMVENYPEENKKRDIQGAENMQIQCAKYLLNRNSFKKVMLKESKEDEDYYFSSLLEAI